MTFTPAVQSAPTETHNSTTTLYQLSPTPAGADWGRS
jgi:hypothetical protein